MPPDIEAMRGYVADLYPGRWKKRVSRMDDSQVMAIYFREQKKAEVSEAEAEEKEEEKEDDIPF